MYCQLVCIEHWWIVNNACVVYVWIGVYVCEAVSWRFDMINGRCCVVWVYGTRTHDKCRDDDSIRLVLVVKISIIVAVSRSTFTPSVYWLHIMPYTGKLPKSLNRKLFTCKWNVCRQIRHILSDMYAFTFKPKNVHWKKFGFWSILLCSESDDLWLPFMVVRRYLLFLSK